MTPTLPPLDDGTLATAQSSQVLTQMPTEPRPSAGRVAGVVAGHRADPAGIGAPNNQPSAQDAVPRVIAPIRGTVGSRIRIETHESTSAITGSIEFDAILVAAGSLANSKLIVLLKEAFRHARVLGAWGDGAAALEVDITAPGVLASDSIVAASSKELIALLGLHQVWDHAAPIMNPAGPAA